MSKQIMTLCEYQALYERSRDLRIIETDGLLIVKGLADEGEYLALHAFAARRVAILWPDKDAAASKSEIPT